MHEPKSQSEYMLLFRGRVDDKNLSPDELQDVMTRWMGWYDGLVGDGRMIAGQPLTTEGKFITGRARAVADGPFAESKEAIAGYFLLRVDSFEEGLAIARLCPGLDHGTTVEVRQIAEMCTARKVTEQLAGATA